MKKQTLFLVDSWNNHRVIGEFDTTDQVNEYLEAKEHTENWENTADSFAEFLDGFYTVEGSRMREAVRKYGNRKLEYWSH